MYGETSIGYTIKELENDLGRFEPCKARNIEVNLKQAGLFII